MLKAKGPLRFSPHLETLPPVQLGLDLLWKRAYTLAGEPHRKVVVPEMLDYNRRLVRLYSNGRIVIHKDANLQSNRYLERGEFDAIDRAFGSLYSRV